MDFNYKEDAEINLCIRCEHYSQKHCIIQEGTVSPFATCDQFLNWRSKTDSAIVVNDKVIVKGQLLPLSEYEIIADNLESLDDEI